MSVDFGPLVVLMSSLAPTNWSSMRVIYNYADAHAMASIRTFAITHDSVERKINEGQRGFEMMDFFDAYREKTQAGQQKRWTWVSVSIKRDDKTPIVEFGYDPPNILQR